MSFVSNRRSYICPKISFHAVSTLDKEIKRNPKVKDPCSIGVGWGTASAQDINISIFNPPIPIVIQIANPCSI